MNHTKSKVIVFQTTDYKLFENMDGNRPLNKKKISRIIEEIKSGNDILDQVPVLVKETKNKLQVVDGQHRVDIAKQLKRPVHYIIKAEDMNLYNVAKVNSNVEKWSDQNFIDAYVKAGNNNYSQLDKFHKKYGFAVGVCLTMLTHGGLKADFSASAQISKEFQNGSFEVKKLKEATQLAEICKQFEDFPGWSSRNFVVAISKIIVANKCELDILLRKFKANIKALEIQRTWRSYLTNLEEIYNAGNSKRRVIY